MVSEYIHAVAHEEQEDTYVRQLATRTWNSLKRSAKAGPRRTVSYLTALTCLPGTVHGHGINLWTRYDTCGIVLGTSTMPSELLSSAPYDRNS